MQPFITLIISVFMLSTIQAQKDTLIYVGDPMCSWCYGFSPELDKIKEAFPETAFEMVMGGLRAGGTEKMNELKDFLKGHWQEVQKATNQPFNYAILEQDEVLYDTEPACRAVVTVCKMDVSKQYAYFKAVQSSFYYHNALPNDDDTYVQLAAKMGLDPEKFHKQYRDDQTKADTYAEFELAQRMGVQGFPTLIAKIDGKLYIATNGFQKAERIITLLKNRGLK